LSVTKNGIQRFDAEEFGDILAAPTGAVITSGIISSTARDDGSSPTTYLRAGLVLSKLSSGLLKEFGENFTRVTGEDVGTGTGSVAEFSLAKEHVVPHSETIYIDGVAQTNDQYSVDYQLGIVKFKTAPSSGEAITADYTHIDYNSTYGYVTDGTEVPYAVLLDPVSLLDMEGVAQNTSARIILAGLIKPDSLIVEKEGALDYAKAYLSRHGFFGIPDETEF
jgi:hypothetical protein